MSDPKRLLSDLSSLASDEQRALLSASQIAPPPELQSEVLVQVLAALGASGAGAAGAAGTGSSSAGLAGTGAAGSTGSAAGAGTVAAGFSVGVFVKPFLIGAGLAVAALGTKTAISPDATSPRTQVLLVVQDSPKVEMPVPVASSPLFRGDIPSPAPNAQVETRPSPVTSQPSVPSPASSPAPAEIAVPAVSAVPTSVVPTASAEDHTAYLRLEASMVARAREALRSGRSTECLSTLTEIDSQIPRGILGQEREALAIEALSIAGQKAAVRQRATAFLNRYPTSPHASAVTAAMR